jgi:hypothetical protein
MEIILLAAHEDNTKRAKTMGEQPERGIRPRLPHQYCYPSQSSHDCSPLILIVALPQIEEILSVSIGQLPAGQPSIYNPLAVAGVGRRETLQLTDRTSNSVSCGLAEIWPNSEVSLQEYLSNLLTI